MFSMKNWPIIRNFDDDIELLKNFDKQTNYKFLVRFICCVCGRFEYVSNEVNYLYDSCVLLDKSHMFNKSNLNSNKFDFDFIYDEPFSCLNDLVLCPKGFYAKEKKVSFH